MNGESSSKRGLKRLKIWAVLGLVLIILFGAAMNDVSAKAGGVVKNDLLTVKDVTRTIEKAGLAPVPDPTVKPSDFKIGDIEPSIYKLKKTDGDLFIYRFASIGERNKKYREWADQNRKNGSNPFLFSPEWPYNQAFAARNIIIVYALNQFPTEEYAAKTEHTLIRLGKTIFYHLNDGHQRVYQGEGKNWKGQVILNYYDHFWRDDQGVLQYDGWNHEQPVLTFKGDPSTIAGEFSYEFKSLSGALGGSDSDGFDARRFAEVDRPQNYGGAILGWSGIGGSGARLPEDSPFLVTVKWNNKVETFELKAMSQR